MTTRLLVLLVIALSGTVVVLGVALFRERQGQAHLAKPPQSVQRQDTLQTPAVDRTSIPQVAGDSVEGQPDAVNSGLEMPAPDSNPTALDGHAATHGFSSAQAWVDHLKQDLMEFESSPESERYWRAERLATASVAAILDIHGNYEECLPGEKVRFYSKPSMEGDRAFAKDGRMYRFTDYQFPEFGRYWDGRPRDEKGNLVQIWPKTGEDVPALDAETALAIARRAREAILYLGG